MSNPLKGEGAFAGNWFAMISPKNENEDIIMVQNNEGTVVVVETPNENTRNFIEGWKDADTDTVLPSND